MDHGNNDSWTSVAAPTQKPWGLLLSKEQRLFTHHPIQKKAPPSRLKNWTAGINLHDSPLLSSGGQGKKRGGEETITIWLIWNWFIGLNKNGWTGVGNDSDTELGVIGLPMSFVVL